LPDRLGHQQLSN